jgi:uncharacterized membrane protein (DUF485 family)
MAEQHEQELIQLAGRRWRIAAVLSLIMIASYFSFIALVAFAKPTMAQLLTPGLSLGMLLGALQIILAWVLTGIYVRWANQSYDPELHRLRGEGGLR